MQKSNPLTAKVVKYKNQNSKGPSEGAPRKYTKSSMDSWRAMSYMAKVCDRKARSVRKPLRVSCRWKKRVREGFRKEQHITGCAAALADGRWCLGCIEPESPGLSSSMPVASIVDRDWRGAPRGGVLRQRQGWGRGRAIICGQRVLRARRLLVRRGNRNLDRSPVFLFLLGRRVGCPFAGGSFCGSKLEVRLVLHRRTDKRGGGDK